MKALPRGIFILFEGGDKVGKTTQLEMAERYLESKGYPVLRTKEPGGGDIAIREKVLSDESLTAEEQLALFCEDRRIHVEQKILPALKEKKIVLCDRFEPSSIAYQGAGGGMPVNRIREQSGKARSGTWPDMILLYDVDPEKAFTRARAETSFEKKDMDYQRRVRKSFLEQAEEDINRWNIIDASRSVEDVWKKTKKCIDAFFLRRFGIQI